MSKRMENLLNTSSSGFTGGRRFNPPPPWAAKWKNVLVFIVLVDVRKTKTYCKICLKSSAKHYYQPFAILKFSARFARKHTQFSNFRRATRANIHNFQIFGALRAQTYAISKPSLGQTPLSKKLHPPLLFLFIQNYVFFIMASLPSKKWFLWIRLI